uniref:Uncharacterized protein n=1 Tax=candidate division CPR3 bacterium TaxID=2268181 RepID=A0A7V3J9D0_UNCC3
MASMYFRITKRGDAFFVSVYDSPNSEYPYDTYECYGGEVDVETYEFLNWERKKLRKEKGK